MKRTAVASNARAASPRGLWRWRDVLQGVSGLKRSLSVPLVNDPGTAWEYGVNTDWLGLVGEKLSGQRVGAYLRHHIYGPLGMNDSTFEPDAEQRARRIKPAPSTREAMGDCLGLPGSRTGRWRPGSRWHEAIARGACTSLVQLQRFTPTRLSASHRSPARHSRWTSGSGAAYIVHVALVVAFVAAHHHSKFAYARPTP